MNQIVNIASKLFTIKKYNGKVDYIIFDEGLAQAAISLSVNSSISAEENLKRIVGLVDGCPEIKLIDTRIEIVEAMRRIEIRNSRETRIEVMKNEKEKETLMERYKVASEHISEIRDIPGIDIVKPGEGGLTAL